MPLEGEGTRRIEWDEGVFDIPKDPALAIEFEAGTKVYVDEDAYSLESISSMAK
jgi:predicted RecA/RadA family phage recombinase